MRRLCFLAVPFVSLLGCAHSAGSLAGLSAPLIGCEEDDVRVLDVVSRDGGHTFRAYCRGQSHECAERDDTVTCDAEARVLATDSERSRVSATDRSVQVSGEGNATILQQGIDAGRSRLTLYAYPRTADEHVAFVLDSRNRASSREGCAFSMVADDVAEGLENVSYERTAFGERIAVRGTLSGLRRVAQARRALLRICEEELAIEAEDRSAVARFVERYDIEAAAATAAGGAATPPTANPRP